VSCEPSYVVYVSAPDRDSLRVEVLEEGLCKFPRSSELVAQLSQREAALMTICELEHATAHLRQDVGVVVQRLRDANGAAGRAKRCEVVGVEV
jgi:hypothetical protein